jgi:predicted transglutaminase-like cysteine proteinase
MSKRYCIAIILGCAVVYFLLIAFCLSESPHQGVADDPTVKGKGRDGACMDYALALSSQLAANGIHGQLIFYRWHIRNTAIQGSHVLVVYRLADDSEWIVDNEIPHPRRVPREASPMQLVFLLSHTQPASVDVELQDGLNHLSYF